MRRGNYVPRGLHHKDSRPKKRNQEANFCHNGSPQETRHILAQGQLQQKPGTLVVYNSVIISKLLYGLESLEPTDATGKLLNTFQLKGLRKILRLHTTFIQRQNTNEYVYRRANDVLNSPTEGNGRKIKPLTEVLEERRLKLLGHVLGREREHPLHQAAFKTQSALPRETEQRRVGRPRKFWTTSNMEKAWEIITIHDGALQNSPFDKHNRHMRERIIDQTRAYLPPFD